MASTIKIKRSTSQATPSALAEGELAHSEVSKQIFIGTNGGLDMEIIGGKKFTDMLDHTPGTLTASSAIVTDANNKIDQLNVDDLRLDGAAIINTATNGNVNISGNGTGHVEVNRLAVTGSASVITEITNAADLDGGSASALATAQAIKAYVDSVASGLTVKTPVLAASTTDVDLASTSEPAELDGVTITDGSRVLLKNQVDATENGIYIAVTATNPSTWTRAADFDEPSEVKAGVFVFVETGDTQADTGWVVTSDNPLVIGAVDIIWNQFSGAGSISAGDGLTKTGNTLSVVASDIAGAGLEDDGSNNLRISTGGVTNANLQNSSVTVTAGAGLTNGGSVSLGGTVTLDLNVDNTTVEVSADVLQVKDGGITNAKLDNDSITVTAGTGLTGGGTVALGGTITLNATASDPSELAGPGLIVNGDDELEVQVDDSSIEIDTDTLRVKAAGITNAMLAGSISNDKLVNDDVTVTAGNGLTGGGTVALGGSITVDVAVDDSSIEINADALRVKAAGITNAMLAGSIANNKLANDSVTITAGAGLTGGGEVDLGATITVDVNVDNSSIEINADALRIKAAGVTNAMLAGNIDNSKLANSSFTAAGDTGSDTISLGETITYAGDNGIEVDVTSGVVTVDLVEVDGGSF